MKRNQMTNAASRQISDQMLQRLRRLAYSILDREPGALEGEFLRRQLPELLDELQERRIAMASSNVVPFPRTDLNEVPV